VTRSEAIFFSMFVGFICGAVFGAKMAEDRFKDDMTTVEQVATDLSNGKVDCEEVPATNGNRFKCEIAK